MFRRLALVLITAMALPACATITTGTSQSITVLTEPVGATCELQRDSTTIGIVNPTPGTVQISKSSRDLTVRCNRAGHSTGILTVTPQFQGMTAGNILLGGVIGLGIDAASGALSEYPVNMTVVLPPQQFETLAERDTFFATRTAETRRQFAERIAGARSSCAPGNSVSCDASAARLEAERDAELARLDGLLGAATYTRASN